MAIRKIARLGHPLLRRPAEAVADPWDPEIRRLIADMKETLEDADGAGLAAPQVHAAVRIVVFRAPLSRIRAEDRIRAEEEPGAQAGEAMNLENMTVLINPVITPLEETQVVGLEGCLSVPDWRGRVPRYQRIRYAGLSETGERLCREAVGFHARVVQHEVDHLDGRLYLDRMPDLEQLFHVEELRHHQDA